MYNAVFSALMTLTGLTFAALGLLLEGRERHWIRHSKVWQELRSRSLLVVAALVIATSSSVLWRIDSKDDPFTRWWWLTIILFVFTLLALAWTLVDTRRLVEPKAILERLRRRHFDESKLVSSPEKSVDSYMVDVKELLVGTLGEGDTNNYRATHSDALVKPASPPAGLEDCVPHSFPDDVRILAVGLLAVEALGEARAQFDAGAGSRTVNLICADTMVDVLEAWARLDIDAIKEERHCKTAKDAREEVLRKGCDVVSQSLESALTVSRPSQTLVDRLESALRFVLPLVDVSTRFAALERLLTAAERAVASGKVEEALNPLSLVTPEFIESLGAKQTQALHRLASSIPSLTEDVLAARRPELPLSARIVPMLLRDHEVTARFLGELQTASDATCQQLLRHVYSSDLVRNRRTLFQTFFEERIPTGAGDSAEGAERAAAWLQPVADHLARVHPAGLGSLRQHAVTAMRSKFSADAVVNPLFLMAIFSMIRVERRRMRDERPQAVDPVVADQTEPETPAIPEGTLSSVLDGRRENVASVSRVPVSSALWQCLNILENGLQFSRQTGEPVMFSREVRRSVMGSLSFVVHGLDEVPEDELRMLLLDERLPKAIETVFELGVVDLGDVSLYLDRFRSASELATGLDAGSSLAEIAVRNRWRAIRLLCEAAYFDTGCGRPAEERDAESTTGGDDASTPRSPKNNGPGVDGLIAGLIDSIRSLTPVVTTTPEKGTRGDMVEDALAVSRFLGRDISANSPEADLWAGMKEMTDGASARIPLDAARRLCCSVLVELTMARLPQWADRLAAECDRALGTHDVETAYMLLRAVRSCLKRVEGSRDRLSIPTGGPFYVFGDSTLGPADQLRAGSIVMKAMIEDWLTRGIDVLQGDTVTGDDLRKSANAVVGWVRRAVRTNLENEPDWQTIDRELLEVGRKVVGQRTVTADGR
jgi:hypothetical protein